MMSIDEMVRILDEADASAGKGNNNSNIQEPAVEETKQSEVGANGASILLCRMRKRKETEQNSSRRKQALREREVLDIIE